MIYATIKALRAVGYDPDQIQFLIRADMPRGYRGMSLDGGVVLGAEAFSTQDMLNHVVEEEIRHLQQKAIEPSRAFGPGTARLLEEEIDESRRVPLPGS